MKNIFFDMDGVLSIWDEGMRLPTEERPCFKAGVHYFKHLNQNKQIYWLTRELMEHKYHLYLVSHTINDEKLAVEHLHDKQTWLSEQYPDIFKNSNIIWIPNQNVTKSEAVRIVLDRELSKEDILIDDFNGNVTDWNKSGGTGVKYLNGFNSPDSFNGLQISITMTVPEIINRIENIPLT